MFLFKTRRENREQFRLLEMEIELLKDEIESIKNPDSLPVFPHSRILTNSHELFNYEDLREKYRPFTKVFK